MAKTYNIGSTKKSSKLPNLGLIKEYGAEMLLRTIGNLKDTPMKTILGPAEKAYLAKRKAKSDERERKRIAKCDAHYTVTSVSVENGKVCCVDTHVARSRAGAVRMAVTDMAKILEIKAPIGNSGTTASGYTWVYNINGLNDEEDENAILRCKVGERTIVWCVQTTYTKKKK